MLTSDLSARTIDALPVFLILLAYGFFNIGLVTALVLIVLWGGVRILYLLNTASGEGSIDE